MYQDQQVLPLLMHDNVPLTFQMFICLSKVRMYPWHGSYQRRSFIRVFVCWLLGHMTLMLFRTSCAQMRLGNPSMDVASIFTRKHAAIVFAPVAL